MSEIDPELSATWRAASAEQPPAVLDDAIRAAARREVGAKPGGFRAAPRWWPLAAAATVAAVAVSIVQMTPPEQVTPATFPATMDAPPRNAKADTEKPMANGAQRETAAAALPEVPRDAGQTTAKEQRPGASDEKKRDVGAGGRSDSFVAAPNEQFQTKKALAADQASRQRLEETPERDQALKQKTELAAASSAARQSPAVASPPAASAPRNELQPFPATPMPADRVASNVSPPMAAATPAPGAAPAIAARKLAAQSPETGASFGNSAGNIARNGAGNAEPPPAKDASALGKVTAGGADKISSERRKDSAPLAPDEWIKRIRRLIAEGKNEDAARELTAFRREYKERSESLLPSDLRAFRQ